jgi:hypothetical protein
MNIRETINAYLLARDVARIAGLDVDAAHARAIERVEQLAAGEDDSTQLARKLDPGGLSRFIAERCSTGCRLTVPRSRLWAAYQAWAAAASVVAPLGRRTFNVAVAERGIAGVGTGGRATWIGIGIGDG